ncbi:hypothetical protein CDAR_37071 [Caerostris darwini]|uniref:Uncharacterized protein n=1 Tax=Caerostris darwini TaxID=1538125 RepID=A0AAV4TL44_9ARAC|nr:hypothetical protein CDAR_37071 [Caerostris darwini]
MYAERFTISFASISTQTDDTCSISLFLYVQKSFKKSTAKSKSTNTAHYPDKLSTLPSSSSIKQTSNVPNPSTSSSSTSNLLATPRHTNYKFCCDYKKKI